MTRYADGSESCRIDPQVEAYNEQWDQAIESWSLERKERMKDYDPHESIEHRIMAFLNAILEIECKDYESCEICPVHGTTQANFCLKLHARALRDDLLKKWEVKE
jgi:hypothetical protein